MTFGQTSLHLQSFSPVCLLIYQQGILLMTRNFSTTTHLKTARLSLKHPHIAYKMAIDEMSVDQMSFDHMSCCRFGGCI
jgi:hypothetical protein